MLQLRVISTINRVLRVFAGNFGYAVRISWPWMMVWAAAAVAVFVYFHPDNVFKILLRLPAVFYSNSLTRIEGGGIALIPTPDACRSFIHCSELASASLAG